MRISTTQNDDALNRIRTIIQSWLGQSVGALEAAERVGLAGWLVSRQWKEVRKMESETES